MFEVCQYLSELFWYIFTNRVSSLGEVGSATRALVSGLPFPRVQVVHTTEMWRITPISAAVEESPTRTGCGVHAQLSAGVRGRAGSLGRRDSYPSLRVPAQQAIGWRPAVPVRTARYATARGAGTRFEAQPG